MASQSPAGGAPGGGGAQAPPSGPPYLLPVAQLGGTPTKAVDVPICAVLVAIFVAGAALNMTIFRRNRGRGHKFIPSAAVFGFCMARINAAALRIASACHPTNVSLAIAAAIFFNAGVLILFIINLIFLQRFVRAYHPRLGWGRPLTFAFRFLYFCVFACLVMVITSVVYGFYTLDQAVQAKLTDIRRTAAVYMAILAFIPLPGTILCVLAARGRPPVDPFGAGSVRTKIALVLFTTSLLSLGAGFRCALGFMPRPLTNPGWFNHKACYYCLNYLVEVIVVFTYALSRFDRRFWVPNGSSKPGHYSSGGPAADAQKQEGEITPEEERIPTADEERQREKSWERHLKSELQVKEAV